MKNRKKLPKNSFLKKTIQEVEKTKAPYLNASLYDAAGAALELDFDLVLP